MKRDLIKYCKVRSLKGTADNKPVEGFGSWIVTWKTYKGCDSPRCACESCDKLAEDGAHVKKVGVNDDRWYIVPLCHEHNECVGDFWVLEHMLMPANKDGFDDLI